MRGGVECKDTLGRTFTCYYFTKERDVYMTGIYMIKNKLNNKIYVGQSSNIENRWWKHKSFLNKNTHHNKRLQEDWNKYGKENFMMKILEECPNSLLNEREIYWINHFNSFENGYNLNIGGTGINGYKHTFDEIFRMRLIKSPMPVLQFDIIGKSNNFTKNKKSNNQ